MTRHIHHHRCIVKLPFSCHAISTPSSRTRAPVTLWPVYAHGCSQDELLRIKGVYGHHTLQRVSFRVASYTCRRRKPSDVSVTTRERRTGKRNQAVRTGGSTSVDSGVCPTSEVDIHLNPRPTSRIGHGTVRLFPLANEEYCWGPKLNK